MLFPLVLVDIHHRTTGLFHRSSTIAPRMASALVVITLVIAEFVFQVSRSPEESMIQKQHSPRSIDDQEPSNFTSGIQGLRLTLDGAQGGLARQPAERSYDKQIATELLPVPDIEVLRPGLRRQECALAFQRFE